MAKERKTVARGQRQIERLPVRADAIARRVNGNAVKLELVFQPEDAARLTDQIVHALVRDGRRR
jgi:hypothetical protein